MADFYQVVTPPTSQPVTLQEAKDHCKIQHNAEDALVTAWIIGATNRIESHLNRCFVQRQIDCFVETLDTPSDTFGAKTRGYQSYLPHVDLLRSPLVSVDGVAVSRDGTFEDFTDYNVIKSAGYWRVRFGEDNFTFNGFGEIDDIPQPLRIRFTAGYGAAADVPEEAKTAIKQLVAYWWANRGDADPDTLLSSKGTTGIPDFIMIPISHLRVRGVF